MEVIGAVLLAALSFGASPPSAAQATGKAPVVLFMCPHGAAKSLMASAYFQKLARERGLNVRVDSAGTDPDPVLAKSVVSHLQKNGYAIPIEKPRAATAADMDTADVVISIGCDLSHLPAPKGQLKNWRVPDFSASFDAAERAIQEQVQALVEEILARKMP